MQKVVTRHSSCCNTRNLRISISLFYSIILLIDTLTKVKKEGVSSKILEGKFKCRFKFNQTSVEENINPSTDYTDESTTSHGKNSLEANFSSSISTPGTESHPEDIEFSDNEEAQKPPESNTRKQIILHNKFSKEKIPLRTHKSTISCVCPSSISKKVMAESKHDCKEGWLEKKSKSLFKTWKKVYCQLGNSQFAFYKNASTGLLSGFIDFTKIIFKITIDRSSKCFM